MDEKCKQYESLFTFRSQEELMEHIQTCDECKHEHEKMQKVSELIQEVKPYFLKKRKNTARLKVACALFLIALCSTTLGVINFNTDIADTLKYGETLTAEDLGLPVDSYGLIYFE
jgi:ERCC4-related helicase